MTRELLPDSVKVRTFKKGKKINVEFTVSVLSKEVERIGLH